MATTGKIYAQRCSRCDTNWPLADNFKKCPTCGRETWEASGEQPMTAPEATEHVKQFRARIEAFEKFEKFYEDREVARLLEEAESALSEG